MEAAICVGIAPYNPKVIWCNIIHTPRAKKLLWILGHEFRYKMIYVYTIPLMIHVWRMVTENCVWRKIWKCCVWHLILKHCACCVISKHCVWRLPGASQTQSFEIRRQTQDFKIMRQTSFSVTMCQTCSMSPATYSCAHRNFGTMLPAVIHSSLIGDNFCQICCNPFVIKQAWLLEARELQTFCKFEEFVLSDRHEIHINYVVIELLLVM